MVTEVFQRLKQEEGNSEVFKRLEILELVRADKELTRKMTLCNLGTPPPPLIWEEDVWGPLLLLPVGKLQTILFLIF